MFNHLHVHSQYSLLQSTCTFEKLCEKAKEYNMSALAITDYGNMFGAVEFYFLAKKMGIKPIIGLEAHLASTTRFEKLNIKEHPTRNIILLAKNYEGYQNLCRLSSAGYQEGFYYKPRIDYEILEKYSENIIALTGGFSGEVYWTFANRGADKAIEKIKNLKRIFKDRLYLQINKMSTPICEQVNPFLMKASQEHSIPLVAGNNVHYISSDDRVAQEALICIASNKTLQDDSRYKLGSSEFYFKSSEEMVKLFADCPEACENTLKISDLCNIEFRVKDDKGQPIYHLPSFPTSNGRTLREEMKIKANKGLEQRFKEAKERKEPIEDKQKYQSRLEYELGVIDKMGFNGYFLIVQDFINWAKSKDIPVGPGRGSGAGSIVAYSLNITDLDPMPYNLIFERFLNPERVSMPDFDIDFCQIHRGRVIDYVTQKYGAGSVSQIITYGRLQTRAAIRDIGRVLGINYLEVDVIAKLIPDILGITLQESIDKEPRLKEKMEANPRVDSLIRLALKIEGLVRHAGIHAAGVIIANGDIVSHAPLYRGGDGENVVQFDMKHIEKIGLIKFDFLGLRTLTHIQETFRLIEKNRGKKLTTKDIPLTDSGIYKLLCKGDTSGIFQLEGDGISNLIKQSQPHCFEDIVAINALYRPGPMEMIPEYLKCREDNSKIKYEFPELKEITEETLGIIIYQEQVQLIAAKIADYTLGEADLLRRAMGKKIKHEMDQQKERFVAGARKNNFDEKKANKLFDRMSEFAKYGFNKSHAAAYCVIAAQTAYLKYYYPVEFFAALLSTDISDTGKVVKYVRDAKKHEIEVKPPHVNSSDYKFNVKGDDIFFSLAAVKGVGQLAANDIIDCREKTPDKKFHTIEDFFYNIDFRKVNKKTIESLIKAGGLDGFGFNRADLFHNYPSYVSAAERHRFDKEIGQKSLFETSDETKEEEKVIVKSCKEWSRSEKLALEKQVLGFYLSDHPLMGLDQIVWPHKIYKIEELITHMKKQDKLQEKGKETPTKKQWKPGQKRHSDKPKQMIIGLISLDREIITKKGTRMAFFELEDLTDSVEAVAFPQTFKEYESVLKSEEPLCVTGHLDLDNNGQIKFIIDKAKSLSEVFAKTNRLVFNIDKAKKKKLEELNSIFKSYTSSEGEVDLFLRLELDDLNKSVELHLEEKVAFKIEMFEEIYSTFGDTNFIEINA